MGREEEEVGGSIKPTGQFNEDMDPTGKDVGGSIKPTGKPGPSIKPTGK
ncbi:MAG: hypothetical protein KJP09_03030 [Bacteroidia bacterium]|nr:hypothetical protein [Bacteroidia bacterium]MBT8309914.1 hypothetical protein [Bacteroidia bacterium]NND09835.1 hypothetical protein [Flavobacteriaceae bacterium]NNK27067.1 hypothetical protein [Flavobacteriaceae bacterium]NNL59966.1 hypothetical protein [Flavobacteriaceae bacterium]